MCGAAVSNSPCAAAFAAESVVAAVAGSLVVYLIASTALARRARPVDVAALLVDSVCLAAAVGNLCWGASWRLSALRAVLRSGCASFSALHVCFLTCSRGVRCRAAVRVLATGPGALACALLVCAAQVASFCWVEAATTGAVTARYVAAATCVGFLVVCFSYLAVVLTAWRSSQPAEPRLFLRSHPPGPQTPRPPPQVDRLDHAAGRAGAGFRSVGRRRIRADDEPSGGAGDSRQEDAGSGSGSDGDASQTAAARSLAPRTSSTVPVARATAGRESLSPPPPRPVAALAGPKRAAARRASVFPWPGVVVPLLANSLFYVGLAALLALPFVLDWRIGSVQSRLLVAADGLLAPCGYTLASRRSRRVGSAAPVLLSRARVEAEIPAALLSPGVPYSLARGDRSPGSKRSSRGSDSPLPDSPLSGPGAALSSPARRSGAPVSAAPFFSKHRLPPNDGGPGTAAALANGVADPPSVPAVGADPPFRFVVSKPAAGSL